MFCPPVTLKSPTQRARALAHAFRVCKTSQRTLVSCPKSLESGGWVCTRVQPRCVRVRTCCQDMRGQMAEIDRGRKKEREGERARMKERGGDEWERPPLAVPPDWFELGTPAGIQARTSCRGVWVCVCAHAERWEGRRTDKSKREERTETKRRGPATCRQFLIRLWCAPHNEDQMH